MDFNRMYRAVQNSIGTAAVLTSIITAGLPAVAANQTTFVPGRLLVKYNPVASAEQVRTFLATAKATDMGSLGRTGVHILKMPTTGNEISMAHAFALRREVAFAEVDRLCPPAQTGATPTDPYYSSAWHLPKISAPGAWKMTTGSSAVTIAILDSGVDATHPDLAPKIVPGWNFYDNNSNTSDVYGHGTAVAGAAAACSNNGIGVTSVAWNCKIMPIRVTDTYGSCGLSMIADGLTWAADHGARVANISFEVWWSPTVATAAQYFQSKGGVVTIAAGNDTYSAPNPDCPYELTVSATDRNDALTSWSNTGNMVDIAAPGDYIYSTGMGGGYGNWSGTSFSAPIVAGVAALVISANPNLSGVEVRNILEQSADDLGAPGWDPQYGYGRVNAARAVSMAMPAPTPDTTPPTVSFASPGNGAAISGAGLVQMSASDNIGIASVTLYLDGSPVAAMMTAPYNTTWDTTKVANGSHALKAVAVDAAGNSASAQINVNVSNVGDAIPPSVTITSPMGGSVGRSLTVTASASDNVGVKRVELWVDGSLSQTLTASPWSFPINIKRLASGPHTFQCKAYDAAGNVGTSQIVTVTK